MRPKPKYHIEIDVGGGIEASGIYQSLYYGDIEAEGNSLAECLENATVAVVSERTGDAVDFMEAHCDWMQDAVEKEFMRKYPPPAGDKGLNWREGRQSIEGDKGGARE